MIEDRLGRIAGAQMAVTLTLGTPTAVSRVVGILSVTDNTALVAVTFTVTWAGEPKAVLSVL